MDRIVQHLPARYVGATGIFSAIRPQVHADHGATSGTILTTWNYLSFVAADGYGAVTFNREPPCDQQIGRPRSPCRACTDGHPIELPVLAMLLLLERYCGRCWNLRIEAPLSGIHQALCCTAAVVGTGRPDRPALQRDAVTLEHWIDRDDEALTPPFTQQHL